MRIHFYDPKNSTEASEYADLLSRIDGWWDAFARDGEKIGSSFSKSGDPAWNKGLPNWMHKHLNAVDPKLMWEYGPPIKTSGHRLVITPESSTHLRPVVDLLLQRQPPLPGWEFYSYRIAETIETMKAMVKSRSHGDMTDSRVTVTLGNHRRIDLKFQVPNCDGIDEQKACHAAFVATETLLGEEILDKWVGAIEIEPLSRPGMIAKLFGGSKERLRAGVSLERLRSTVDAVMAASLEQLDPFAKRPADSNAPGFLFELKPERADDYPGWSDLFIASTPEKELWQATHSSVPFYSCRFSRCGETFAYLKIDGKDRVAGKEVQQRGAIEDALQEVLERDGLGSVISGGTGIAYSYIELALTSMKSGAEAVVQALRGKVPLKSWLLFYDAPLADEWVGIYPETPVPPKVKTKT